MQGPEGLLYTYTPSAYVVHKYNSETIHDHELYNYMYVAHTKLHDFPNMHTMHEVHAIAHVRYVCMELMT